MKKISQFIKAKAIEIIVAIATVAAVIVAMQGNQITQLEANRKPRLVYHVLVLNPTEKDDDISTALQDLENLIFSSVYTFAEQNPEKTYSEALDSVLPLSKTVSTSASGDIIVVRNRGDVTASNVRIQVTFAAPIKDFQVFTNEQFSIVGGGRETSEIKVEIDRLTAGDSIHLLVLLETPNPNQYTVITASRKPFSEESTNEQSLTQSQQAAATQTAKAPKSTSSTTTNASNILFFSIERVNDVPFDIFVSSNETGGSPAESDDNTPDDIRNDMQYLNILTEMYESTKNK